MVEVAVLAPLFITFLAALLIAMRIQHGGAVVSQAAADAARRASIVRTAAQARTEATSSALATLHERGLHCAPDVKLDLSGYARPTGQNAIVTAQVTCRVQLADIALPGMPGARTVTKTHRSPIDPYRGR
ncbi:hypothetical protein [Spirillospora sp. NBC_01491]|uniref:hypothetical protein n=1 Tax=Spirillospora sp. NBC_01491 TaxID=2976007 RepID=UPI002E2EC560|nr:hypothetical protein [Spirillospora sp. NBC_01491]